MDPLLFWGENERRIGANCSSFIPIVRRILQRLPSAARVESVWSYFSHVLTNDRSRMLPDRASRMARSYVRDRQRRARLNARVTPKIPVFGVVDGFDSVTYLPLSDDETP